MTTNIQKLKNEIEEAKQLPSEIKTCFGNFKNDNCRVKELQAQLLGAEKQKKEDVKMFEKMMDDKIEDLKVMGQNYSKIFLLEELKQKLGEMK